MVCNDLKKIVYFFLDGELGLDRDQELRKHLKACVECDHRVLIHVRLRHFVKQRLSRDIAPPTLRQRLHDVLRVDESGA